MIPGKGLRISRSFHCPGPAFCPRGAAKSIIRAIAQSNGYSEVNCFQTMAIGDQYVAVNLTESRKLAVQHIRTWTSFVKIIESLK